MADARGTWTVPAGLDPEPIRTIDAHAEGEPLRIIVGGVPMPEGETVPERRRSAMRDLDRYRTMLMWEPRGHADMYGCLVMPPVSASADFSVLFLHNDGFSTMCGHGILAVSAAAVACGFRPSSGPVERLVIDTPAGQVTSRVYVEDGRVRDVRFTNVPSFVFTTDRHLDVSGVGRIRYDVAFGGAFYAFVDATSIGLSLIPGDIDRIVDAGRRIKRAVARALDLEHPDEPDLAFLYGTIFTGPAAGSGRHSRHACVFADGEVDRSPTGTGVSARLALLRHRDALGVDEEIEIESLIGSRFSGRIEAEEKVGDRSCVIPEVGGRAFLTGRHEFIADPADPWRSGFLVR